MSDLNIFLVDPSLFTAPYDIELFHGLAENGVAAKLVTRAARPREAIPLDPATVDPLFYRWSDGHRQSRSLPNKLLKGIEHAIDDVRLARAISRERPDIVHLQWSVLPIVDAQMVRRVQRRTPVVFTVHDTMPFNGAQTSRWQVRGFDTMCQAVSHIIVHTASAASILERRGIDRDRISVIEHGPLPLAVPVRARTAANDPYTFVAFGKLRPYKGLDVLIEALGLVPIGQRQGLRCIIAGEPLMDTEELRNRIAAHALGDLIDLRLHRHDDDQMASLFSEADCFVLPYREIEASGVFHLVRQLGRWTIASALGDFAEQLRDAGDGQLVPAGEPAALSAAIMRATNRRLAPPPGYKPTGWKEIGAQTRRVYEHAIHRQSAARSR